MKKHFLFATTALLASVQLSANEVWPVIMDGAKLEQVQNAVVASFMPDDVGNFIYIWDNTYYGGDATGVNFYGNTEGYLALQVGNVGWSGAGFCLTANGSSWEDADTLRQKIVANPDNYFFHMAIKSTDNAAHSFYVMGAEATHFTLGDHAEYQAPVYADFPRDGKWQEFFIPMSRFANVLSGTTCAAGVNVLVFLSQNMPGAKLNLDAVYFCDKEFMEKEMSSGDQKPVTKDITISYTDKAGAELRNQTAQLTFPVAPEIDGFEFIGWQPVAALIEDKLEIQAVYKSKSEGMPAVVTNPANPTQKLIRNGNVYILRDGRTYTLSGQQVK
jgi:hypothetical protein